MPTTWNTKILAVGLAGIAVSGASTGAGCSATKPTEIVPGALTQVEVPKDLAGIQVDVQGNGVDKFCQGYQVANGFVELPSTLGVVSGSSDETLRVTIRGYDDPTNSQAYLNCGAAAVDMGGMSSTGVPSPRILRQAIVTYVDQQTLFLPMLLSYSCYDVDCSGATPNIPNSGADATCKAGICQDGNVPSSSLVPFDPSLVDGTGECFDASLCMSDALPAVFLNTSPSPSGSGQVCNFQVPAALQSLAQSKGFNVRALYTDAKLTTDPVTGTQSEVPESSFETEILSEDPVEGWTAGPEGAFTFSLPEGLCALYQASLTPLVAKTKTPAGLIHTLSGVDVSAGCPPKIPLLPLCAGQQHNNVGSSNPSPLLAGVPYALVPAPNLIYMVVDKSGAMGNAFADGGQLASLNTQLQSPLFQSTYIALQQLDGRSMNCQGTAGGPYADAAVPFGLARNVQTQIATAFAAAPTDNAGAPAGLYLQAAMSPNAGGAYELIKQNIQNLVANGGPGMTPTSRILLVFVNRDPGDGGAPDDAAPSGSYPTQAVDCTGMAGAQAAMDQDINGAYDDAGIETFFVVLNDEQDAGGSVLPFYSGVQTNSEPTPTNNLNAGMAIRAIDNIADEAVAQFIGDYALATPCVFQTPTGADTTATVGFVYKGFPVASSYVPSCPAGDSSPNWTFVPGTNSKQLQLCAAACGALEATVAGAFETADGGLKASTDGGPLVAPGLAVTLTMPAVDGGTP